MHACSKTKIRNLDVSIVFVALQFTARESEPVLEIDIATRMICYLVAMPPRAALSLYVIYSTYHKQ